MAVSPAGMVARQNFGEELKQARLAARTSAGAKIKQEDAGKAIKRRGPDRVSRLERGGAWPEPWELDKLLKLYGTDVETSVRLKTLLEAGQNISEPWWSTFQKDFPASLIEFVAFEESAVELITGAGNVIPGLFQTADYGRTLTSILAKSTMTSHLVERSIELRVTRRRIFDKPTPPAVEVIIGEAALHQRIGGKVVMLAQLDALLEDATQREVTIRVIPFEASAALTYGFHLISFGGANEKPIAAFDAMTGMSFRKDLREIRGLKGFVESLREVSLSPRDSLERIRTIRKEMSRD